MYLYTNFDMEWLLEGVERCYTKINEGNLNNTVNAPLRTLFITLLVTCYLKYYFVTKRIIIHKYYSI